MAPVKPFVTVHAGAGFHSVAKEADYVAICKSACERGLSILASHVSALDAVVAVMMCLENATCTNAGIGSNLTLYGTVECDASVMDGKTTAFGAVGAVPGIKNPVCLAKRLIEVQAEGLSLGRIPPSLLVGQGALEWAIQQGFYTVSSSSELVTESSEKTYRKYKKRLVKLHLEQASKKTLKSIKESSSWTEKNEDKDSTSSTYHYENSFNSFSNGNSSSTNSSHLPSLNSDGINCSKTQTEVNSFPSEKGLFLSGQTYVNNNNNNSSSSSTTTSQDDGPQINNFSSSHLDTVGAMCVDSQGNIACAVSSGGIALKQPGRLGSAASFGAGCWAMNENTNSPGIGVVTSGTGEHLIRTNFAKEFADCILSQTDTIMAVNMAFDLKFLGSPLLKDVKQKYAGILLVKQMSLNQIELVWSYCTASMCVGYGVAGNEPTAFISRLDDTQIPGKALHVQGRQFCL